MATSKSKLHVAVVMSGPNTGASIDRSLRGLGDWACFVGADRDAVIEKALRARDQWQRGDPFVRSDEADGYQILVGTLDSAVEVPANYELVPLKAGA